MTRCKDLWVDQCAFVILEQKDKYINFSCLSLHALVQKGVVCSLVVCVSPRKANTECYFKSHSCSFCGHSYKKIEEISEFHSMFKTHTHTHSKTWRGGSAWHKKRKLQSADFEFKAEGHQSKICAPHRSMSSVICSLHFAIHGSIKHLFECSKDCIIFNRL